MKPSEAICITLMIVAGLATAMPARAEFLWSDDCGIRTRFERAVAQAMPPSCKGFNSSAVSICAGQPADPRFSYRQAWRGEWNRRPAVLYEMGVTVDRQCLEATAKKLQTKVQARATIIPSRRVVAVEPFIEANRIRFYLPFKDGLDEKEFNRR